MATVAVQERSSTLIAEPEPLHDGVRQATAGQSILRGALAMLRTQPITWGATLVGVIMAPGLLGADALGQVTVANTVSTIGATVAGLGVSEYLVRRVAQHPESLKRDAWIALAVQLVATGLGLVIIACVGSLFLAPIVGFPLLLLALGPMLASPARTVLLSTFRATDQHNAYAWLNTATLVLSTLSGLFVLLLGGNVMGSAAAGGIATIASTAVAWKLSRLRPVAPPMNRAALTSSAEFIRAGFPFLSWQIVQMAYSQIDRLLLGILTPAVQVGWYAAATRISTIPLFIPTLIITPLVPALSRSANDPVTLRKTIAQTLRYTLFLTVPLSAGTIVVAPALPSLFGWPADFSNSVVPLDILALQLPLMASGTVLGSVLMAIGRERRLVLLAAVTTAFNVAVNLVTIPIVEAQTGNGGIGAAAVSVASETLMLVGVVAFIPQGILDSRLLWDAAKILFAGLATVIVGIACLPIGLMACIPAGAATYSILTFVFRIVSVDDIQLLSGRFAGRRA